MGIKKYTPHWIAKNNKDSIQIIDFEGFKNFLKTLKDEVYVIVKNKSKERSNNQNRYYWGVVLKIISEETGYEQYELHDLLKQQFLIKKLDFYGKQYPTCESSAKLSSAEFEEYLTKVRQFASIELGIVLPLPNEIDY